VNVDPLLLALLLPLAIIQIGLIVAALWDLTRPGRQVRGGSRLVWALVILFVNTIGPILYFVLGREEATAVDEEHAVAGWVAPGSAGLADRRAGPGSGSAAASVVEAPAVGDTAAVGHTAAVEHPAAVAHPAAVGPIPTAVGAIPTAEPVVVCRGLTKRFGGRDGVLALDSLDLEVPTGSVFGLLGPNGAGKTTTLRILTGLAHATGGTATVAGTDVTGDGSTVTRRIGYLDQDPRYYGWLTGRELLGMVGRLHELGPAECRARAVEVLARVGLADAADRRIATYSGGMRQRLGIAQALVGRPPVLILDEPVSSLDPEGRRDLLELIAGLRGSATVLFSTHVLADVERVCDRVAILDHGRLVTEGPLDGLLDRYALPVYRLDPEPGQEDAVARLVESLRSADWTTDAVLEHGLVKVTVSDPARAAHELLPMVVSAGVALAGFERARPTLEDVFLQLTGRRAGESAA
jgi:ABC-2 type transport system ATP-binding protein